MSGTSTTNEIRVDWAHELPNGGALGITFAPGKKDPSPRYHGVAWNRDGDADLARLRGYWGTGMLVSLIEDHELELLEITTLPTEALKHGLELVRFPIRDCSVPDDRAATERLVAQIVERMRAGLRVVVHCRGGIGRAGMIAACVLVELGTAPREAIAQVRRARDPRAVETREQERFVEDWRAPSARPDR